MFALDVTAFAGAVGADPDPWQRRCLESRSKRGLLNCSRQSGKSTVCAVMAVHEALFTPKARVLLISPSQRQSSELFKKCAEFLKALPSPATLIQESLTSLELSNRSRIISLPGSEATTRGYRVDEDGDIWAEGNELADVLGIDRGEVQALSEALPRPVGDLRYLQ